MLCVSEWGKRPRREKSIVKNFFTILLSDVDSKKRREHSRTTTRAQQRQSLSCSTTWPTRKGDEESWEMNIAKLQNEFHKIPADSFKSLRHDIITSNVCTTNRTASGNVKQRIVNNTTQEKWNEIFLLMSLRVTASRSGGEEEEEEFDDSSCD